jgi:hypothetical protein
LIKLTHIDLLSLQSSLKTGKDKDGVSVVYDPVRRIYVRSTTEEIVRQLWIRYLLDVRIVNSKLLAVERAFSIQGMKRRFDLVLFDRTTMPVLLAEFKAPGVSVNQVTFDQIAVYNMQLQIPYALVSNGMEHYCFQIDDEKKGFVFLNDLPGLSSGV